MEPASARLEACARDLWALVPKEAIQIAFTLLAVAFGLYLMRTTNRWSDEAPRPYKVPPPRVPEQHSTVEETSIKISGTTAIQCYAPATGQFLGFINPSTPAAIDRAIALASNAQPSWARTTFSQRRAVLRSLLHHILANQRSICDACALDSGKTLVDCQLGEVLCAAERIRWTLANGEAALRPSRRPMGPMIMAHKRNTVHYEPMGVVAALVSWNYPFHNVMGPIASSLFAGNAVVVKVSEKTAWSAGYFAAIARGALVVHGYDPNLIQIVVCWPATASHLTSNPGVSHLTFIGSQTVGHQVAASAAKVLTPLVAELGGKDPAIVVDSASRDLGRIVRTLMRGSFQGAGQNCIGIERIIATPAVYEKLVGMVEPLVKALRVGPEADMGAMISDERFGRLEQLISSAVKDGARLLAGGKRFSHPDYPKGHYFEPTLLVGVTSSMEISNEECFAPIMVITRASSNTSDAILAEANNPKFGLGAAVFGSESDPVLQSVVAGLKAGNVAVNDFAVFYTVQLPFGGVAGSGYGKFAGEEGLRGLCNAKSVCEDKWGWLGMRTSIPPAVQYPVKNQESSWNFVRAVTDLGFGQLSAKLNAILDLIRYG